MSERVEDRPDWLLAYMDHLNVQVPHGSGWRKMRCPFHDDSHASATINTDVGAFKCFGCDVAGTAVNLIMFNEGVEFDAAIRFVKEVLGCSVGSTGNDGTGRGVPGGKGTYRSERKYVPPRSRTWGNIG